MVSDREIVRCGYCNKEIKEGHPKMVHSQVKMDENVKHDRVLDQYVCQDCARDLVDDMSRYKPGKMYIE